MLVAAQGWCLPLHQGVTVPMLVLAGTEKYLSLTWRRCTTRATGEKLVCPSGGRVLCGEQEGLRAVGGCGMVALGSFPQLYDQWPCNIRSQIFLTSRQTTLLYMSQRLLQAEKERRMSASLLGSSG